MIIILSFPTFHKLVTSWIRQSVQLSCHFLTSLTFTVQVNVDVLPPVMHLENIKKNITRKYSAFQRRHRWQHKPQTTGTRIFFIGCLIICVGLITIYWAKKGIKNLNYLDPMNQSFGGQTLKCEEPHNNLSK